MAKIRVEFLGMMPNSNVEWEKMYHLRCVKAVLLNPFTLRVSLESIVCYFHTFENNLGIKQKFLKYLEESCRLTSGLTFLLQIFSKKMPC